MIKFIKILIVASCLVLAITVLLLAYAVFTQKPITSINGNQAPAKTQEYPQDKEKEIHESAGAIPPRNLPKKITF